MQKTIFGYTNYRYFVNNPHGETRWFSTRRQRDAAVDELICAADGAGLSDPHTAFRPVKKIARTDRALDWVRGLIGNGSVGGFDGMAHIWDSEEY